MFCVILLHTIFIYLSRFTIRGLQFVSFFSFSPSSSSFSSSAASSSSSYCWCCHSCVHCQFNKRQRFILLLFTEFNMKYDVIYLRNTLLHYCSFYHHHFIIINNSVRSNINILNTRLLNSLALLRGAQCVSDVTLDWPIFRKISLSNIRNWIIRQRPWNDLFILTSTVCSFRRLCSTPSLQRKKLIKLLLLWDKLMDSLSFSSKESHFEWNALGCLPEARLDSILERA